MGRRRFGGRGPGVRRRPVETLPTAQEVAAAKTEHFTARDFGGLIGLDGLSERLLRNHFELYQGYVKNANTIVDELREAGASDVVRYAELKRRFGWEYDGIRLHELYFENMTRTPAPLDPASRLHARIREDFGGYEGWQKDFRATGAIRGIGWAVLYHDSLRNRLFNAWIEQHHEGHLAGCSPILIMDVWEHAYTLDYGTKRADYLDVFLKSVHWDVVTTRFR